MDISSPKKALGQHFFNNKNLALQIVDIILQSNPKNILEIGPGTGVFTHLINQRGIPLIAVEKDEDKFRLLQMVVLLSNVQFYNLDLLDTTEAQLYEMLPDQKRSIIFGSLPYNSSKKIISHLITNTSVNDFYYIVQKEVAEKYVGNDGGNRISIITGANADTKILKKIAPSNFNPKPKVDSSLIYIRRKPKPLITKDDMIHFEKFIHQAFSNPRKKLSNNLRDFVKAGKIDQSSPILQKRASQLDIEEFVSLFEQTNK